MQKTKGKKTKQSTNHSGSGFVRIIAGKWRGRKLPVKNVEGLRPTTDRVKETLFNWIQADLYQAHCLDLFAGSGSLGFESLSRQAATVTFVEKDKTAKEQLSENINSLQVENAFLHHTDALSFLACEKSKKHPFDIVFIDPPFRQDLLENVCNELEKNDQLAHNALIYIETELSEVNLPLAWQMLKEKKAGQVYYRLYRKEQ